MYIKRVSLTIIHIMFCIYANAHKHKIKKHIVKDIKSYYNLNKTNIYNIYNISFALLKTNRYGENIDQIVIMEYRTINEFNVTLRCKNNGNRITLQSYYKIPKYDIDVDNQSKFESDEEFKIFESVYNDSNIIKILDLTHKLNVKSIQIFKLGVFISLIPEKGKFYYGIALPFKDHYYNADDVKYIDSNSYINIELWY